MRFDNAQELTEIDFINFYQLHANGTVSLDLDLKMQFDNRLLHT